MCALISRRGRASVDVLLSATLVAVALIVAAYLMMPDFQRGVRAIAGDLEQRLRR